MMRTGQGSARIALSMMIMLGGCSGAKVTTKSAPKLQQYHVTRLAVVPFEVTSAPQVFNPDGPSFSVPAGAVRSEITLAVPPANETPPRYTLPVPPSAAGTVTNLVWTKLNAKRGLDVLSPEQVRRALAAARRDNRAQTLEEIGQQIARQLGADAALVGTVNVYQERVGSRIGASPPATVGFEMKLVSQDGAVIWEGNYYERQRPMSEDLWGFIQRHGGFVTADELAAYGAEELAQAFPFGGPAGK